MSIAPLTEVELYELAFRVNSGFEITLYWNAHDGSTTIHIYHSATSETSSSQCRPIALSTPSITRSPTSPVPPATRCGYRRARPRPCPATRVGLAATRSRCATARR
jgi:hypothetical protein